MSLNKQQSVMAASAAGFLVVAGVLGWFLFDAQTARTAQEEELANEMSTFQRYNDAAVFPSLKTIALTRTNQTSLAEWRTAAEGYAARGDKTPDAETPPIFKQRLAATVRKMRALPGAANGHIAAAAFQFGFDAYLGEGGVLPDVKDVPRLSTQLDAIKQFVDAMAAAGVLEIKEIKRIEPQADTETAAAKGRKNARRAKGDEKPKAKSLDYALVFTARPEAVVETLNALLCDTRFTVVKKFAFKMTEDDIVTQMDALAAAKAAAAAQKGDASGGRRGRRRGAAAAAVQAADAAGALAKKGGLVTDPEFGSPIQVEMTLAVWDFGTTSSEPAKETK